MTYAPHFGHQNAGENYRLANGPSLPLGTDVDTGKAGRLWTGIDGLSQFN